MDLLTYYSDLAVAYPEYITQKQFCEVCGICHKTAYNLTRRGEISYEIVDTPTGRIHHIKLTDALAYLYKKDTLYGNDENVNLQIYEVLQAHFSYLPDLLRTQQIRELTGFSMTAIQRWVLEKRIMLTINALTAADSVIIPVQAQYLPAKGLEQLLRTITRVKRQLNPKLEVDGIVLTMVDSRTTLAREINALVRKTYGGHVFASEIPRSIKAAEISVENKSIYDHDRSGKAALAYENLTREVLSLGKQIKRHRTDPVR